MGRGAGRVRTRTTILRSWEASGRPPCPVCGTLIEPGATFRVSRLWNAVVHPYCLQARVGRPSPNQISWGACSFYPGCPIPFHAPGAEYCVCSVVAVINIIFVARRLGLSTVKVPSAGSPAVAEAARWAGLGQHYNDVPPREDPAFDDVRKHGVLGPGIDESVWDQPSSWWAPPEYVTVNVDRTSREGRIIAGTKR